MREVFVVVRKKLGTIVGLLIAIVAMMWPAIYNGQPFFYTDTADYVNAADAGVHKIAGLTSHWTPLDQSASDATHGHSDAGTTTGKSVRAGRSIYYGALLYVGEQAGGFWLSIAIQSLMLVLALALTLKALKLSAWPYLGIIVVLVACLTPAALFASFLMPDVFTGIAILACSLLLTSNASSPHFDDICWFTLLTLSLMFHNSHVLIAGLLLTAGLIAYLTRLATVRAYGLLLIGGSLVLAYVAGAAFNYAVTRFMGESPIVPPFITARIIEDGPGYQYLRDTCPGNGFVVCQFIDRLPTSANEFLWAHDPVHGVFGATDDSTRRRLAHEQWAFVYAVVRHRPLGQVRASIQNALQQALLVGIPEFQYSDEDKQAFAREIPEIYWTAMQKTAAYRGTMPIDWLTYMNYFLLLVGSLYIVVALSATRVPPQPDTDVAYRLAAFVYLGVIFNAIVCGVISGPHDRYQARVVWLIPMMALTLHFKRHERWWQARIQRLPFMASGN
jgi:hypothetical protein